jgi:hypothetical protein
VAIAAAAALFLFATTPVKAGLVDFEIVEPLSFMSISESIDLTSLKLGVYASVPQFPGSDTTSLYGALWADLQPGTIEFPLALPDAIGYRIGAPGVAGVPGLYAPFDPIISPPVFPPAGVTPGGNYGFTVGAPLFLAQIEYNLRGDLLIPGVRPLAGTLFPFVPGTDAILGTDGRIAFSSALGTDTGDVIGDPLAAFGTGGVAPGSWDPSDPTAGPLGTLTIPIESMYTVVVTGTVGGAPIAIPVTFFASGVIKATPKLVPEPSSMVLLGFGVVGLLAYGWRLRKPSA